MRENDDRFNQIINTRESIEKEKRIALPAARINQKERKKVLVSNN
jgi:hypothetical protein